MCFSLTHGIIKDWLRYLLYLLNQIFLYFITFIHDRDQIYISGYFTSSQRSKIKKTTISFKLVNLQSIKFKFKFI